MRREYVPALPEHIHTSIFDRLVDPNPDLAVELPETLTQRFNTLREIFRRDLEALLNTRRFVETLPEALVHLKSSLLNYGVSDFIGASVITMGERDRMARALAETISLMEPRFTDVEVTVLEPRGNIERMLRLKIFAVVSLSEGMRPLTFETSLDPNTRHFSVSGDQRR